jgi:HK97 family phage major capsid protein
MNLRELLERRYNVIERTRSMIDKASNENRNLNQQEQKQYDLSVEEVKNIESEIKEIEAERDKELKMETYVPDDSPGSFNRAALQNGDFATLDHKDSVRSYLEKKGNYDRDIAKVRPGQILRAMALGTSDPVLQRAMGAGQDTAGGYTCPDILASSFIDAMRAQSVMSRAGARTIPVDGDTTYAMVTADPSPAWRAGENTSVEEDEPTFGALKFKPRSLAVMAKISRELLEDSINAESALMNSMSKAMALELDRACMVGDGAAGEPMGLANWENINEVDLSSTPDYDSMLDARTAILTANGPEPNSVIMHPRDSGVLSKLKDGEGQPAPIPPGLKYINFWTTTQIPITEGTGTDSLMLVGNFREAMIVMRTSLRIEVLKELYADKLQYAYLAFLRADFAPTNDESFAKITGIQAA